MEQDEFLRFAAERLDRLGIRYFVTGSFAGLLYGEHRMTNDIDIVVELSRERIDEFLVGFPEDTFYLDKDAVLDAVKTRFQFNVIHRETLAKVDFIISAGGSHDREVMKRIRRFRGTGDYEICYTSPEDLVLKKLTFHRESGSEKHLRDCVGILKKSGGQMDMEYLEKWADWLDVYKGWRETQRLAGT